MAFKFVTDFTSENFAQVTFYGKVAPSKPIFELKGRTNFQVKPTNKKPEVLC